MTTIFVSAVDGSNADNGTTWALAKQTVAGALAIAAANDVIVVDNAGTFTATAAITWTPPAGGIAIISVLRSGASSFTWAAGAIEAVGASSSIFAISAAAASAMYVYGMSLKGGTNASTNCAITLLTAVNQLCSLEMDTCTFDLPSASAVFIQLGAPQSTTSVAQTITMRNCTYNCTGSHVNSYFDVNNAKTEIINPTFNFSGGSKPVAVIFWGNTTQSGTVVMRDGDASGYSVSGGAYVAVGSMGDGSVILENLKLSATPAVWNGTWPGGNGSVTVRNCDSGNTNYTFQFANAYGTLTADASVYATAGATLSGAGISWKIVTTSAASEFLPFITPFIYEWDTILTAQTAGIEIIRDNATALTDRNIWASLDSPASASFPNFTYQTNRNANPFTGTGAAHATSTAAWTGTGGFSNPTKQTLNNAFTAAAAGLLQSRVYVGVASTTLYIDPYLGGIG